MPIHPSDALEKNLSSEQHLGNLDGASRHALEMAASSLKQTKDELRVQKALEGRPPVGQLLSLRDMEVSVKVP